MGKCIILSILVELFLYCQRLIVKKKNKFSFQIFDAKQFCSVSIYKCQNIKGKVCTSYSNFSDLGINLLLDSYMSLFFFWLGIYKVVYSVDVSRVLLNASHSKPLHFQFAGWKHWHNGSRVNLRLSNSVVSWPSYSL